MQLMNLPVSLPQQLRLDTALGLPEPEIKITEVRDYKIGGTLLNVLKGNRETVDKIFSQDQLGAKFIVNGLVWATGEIHRVLDLIDNVAFYAGEGYGLRLQRTSHRDELGSPLYHAILFHEQ